MHRFPPRGAGWAGCPSINETCSPIGYMLLFYQKRKNPSRAFRFRRAFFCGIWYNFVILCKNPVYICGIIAKQPVKKRVFPALPRSILQDKAAWLCISTHNRPPIPIRKRKQSVHLELFKVMLPIPEGRNIRGNRVDIDPFGRVDVDVLPLVVRHLDRPVADDIQRLFVDCPAVALVGGNPAV